MIGDFCTTDSFRHKLDVKMTELVKHPEQLKAYQQAGIDRLVIGL